MPNSTSPAPFALRLLDRLFLWVRSRPVFYRFTLFTRVLLVAGFLPTGLVKLLNQRFSVLAVETPIGAFFEAMYQTGLYWQFIGLCQVLAALLLLVPALAHLGAALFAGIILNIFVITVALDFGGTPWVTGPMLLAAAYLCAWDYHRFRPLFTEAPFEEPVPRHRLDRLEFAGFLVFGASLVAAFLFTRGFFPRDYVAAAVGLGAAGGLFALGRFLWLAWQGRRGGRGGRPVFRVTGRAAPPPSP